MRILYLKSVCRKKRNNYIQSKPEITAENLNMVQEKAKEAEYQIKKLQTAK